MLFWNKSLVVCAIGFMWPLVEKKWSEMVSYDADYFLLKSISNESTFWIPLDQWRESDDVREDMNVGKLLWNCQWNVLNRNASLEQILCWLDWSRELDRDSWLLWNKLWTQIVALHFNIW